MPERLIANVLFGHESDSFPGASDCCVGALEQAVGGVLLLDEIDKLTLASQSVVLRLLDDKKITLVGSSQEISVDVRILATTNRCLAAMVEEGTFRRDLFYRINRDTLSIPPLRERQKEIPLLIELFREEFCKTHACFVRGFSPETRDALERFYWPGNIRQLRNVVESAVARCKGDMIELSHLPDYVISNKPSPKTASVFAEQNWQLREPISLKDQLSLWEVQLIQRAMSATAGNRNAASQLLRIPLRTLSYKLKLHGLLDTDWSKTPVEELLS
jgi:DNA-binding NtrC family response regulator